MTTSPTLTSSGTRWPLSSMRPGPTAMTVPSCGFSLAVYGMTRPEAVVVSASLAWTTTRSSSGLMVTLVAVVTSVTPPSVSDGWGWWYWWLARQGGLPSRGSGPPVSIGTLPTRVPTSQPGSSRRFAQVEAADVRWLRTDEGAAAAARAARLQAEGADLVGGLA